MEEFKITAKQVRKLLSQQYYFQISKPLVATLGLDTAVWIADMISKMDYFEDKGMLDEEGYFFSNQEEIEKTTSITYHRQTIVIQKLKELKIVETKRKGIPARMYYKLNYKNLIKTMDYSVSVLEKSKTSLKPVKNFRSTDQKVYNKNKEIRLNNNLYSSNISSVRDERLCSSEDLPSDKQDTGYSKSKPDRLSYSNKQLVIAPKKEYNVAVSTDVKEIIDYWNVMGLRKTLAGSKTYKDNVLWINKILKGKAYEGTDLEKDWSGVKFTKDEVKLAIKRFSLSVLDLDYEPIDKSKIKNFSIKDFLFNPFSKNGLQSLFIKYKQNAPSKLCQKTTLKEIPDKQRPVLEPIINVFKKFYLETVRAGIKVNLTSMDENNFIDGARKLNNFIYDNHKKIYNVKTDKELAEHLCEAIWKNADEDATKITTGRFKSDYTFNVLLPGHLVNIGVAYSKSIS